MEKRRILFVDDEPGILEGLQNLLRKERQRWDMVFALGGEAALVELQKGPFDVVVSDMRMPGMDGAALLAHVRSDYPSTSRIVLSGHAEQEAVMRALPVAHQYLAKPCQADALRTAVDRTCALQGLLRHEALRQVVGRLQKLPSSPTTYLKLNEAANHPSIRAEEIAGIIEKDPAASLKILQLVNSAYFGLPRKVTAITQAVVYLGVELIKALTLSAQIFSKPAGQTPQGFSIDKLQNQGLRAANLARELMGTHPQRDEAFAAALVADIGELVLAISGLPQCKDLWSSTESTAERHMHEDAALGVSHAEVGAYLLGIWGLPFSMVEAVAYHHRPEAIGQGGGVAAAVHLAHASLALHGRPLPETRWAGLMQRVCLGDDWPRWKKILLTALESNP